MQKCHWSLHLVVNVMHSEQHLLCHTFCYDVLCWSAIKTKRYFLKRETMHNYKLAIFKVIFTFVPCDIMCNNVCLNVLFVVF